MDKKVETAIEYMRGPYSCSQSIMCAFCEDAGISHDEAKEIGTPYAGGRKIKCGGVCAAELILEAKYDKKTASKLKAEFEEKFLEKVGAINCKEIKDHQLRTCIGCVEDAATILSEMLQR